MIGRREFLAGVGAAAGTVIAGAGRVDAQAAAAPDPWQELAGQWQFRPGYSYFNTAGLGACPRVVSERVKAELDREEAAPSAAHSLEDWSRIRGKCAKLLGPSCTDAEVALISTATEGINIVINGLGLKSGDQVVTSTHEHVALAIPLLHKMQTVGIEVRTFEPDLQSSAVTLDRVRALLTPRTRAIFVSHVTCTTGQVLPVVELGRLAAERRLFFALDGAQSLAQFPIDIAAVGAHAYAASCHKFLMGPKRTGLLYVRRDRLPELASFVLGAYSDQANSLADRTLTLRSDAQRFEYGTQNSALFYGLETALDLVQALGLERIWDHNRRLAETFRDGLGRLPQVELLSPADPAARSAMVSFRVRDLNSAAVANTLTGKGLRVRSVTEAGLNAVRASFHVCNTPAQLPALLAAVGEVAAGAPGR